MKQSKTETKASLAQQKNNEERLIRCFSMKYQLFFSSKSYYWYYYYYYYEIPGEPIKCRLSNMWCEITEGPLLDQGGVCVTSSV